MFRSMRRSKQQLSAEDCVELLKREKRGVLSVIGDDGYPYGIPLNHYYAADGKLYFHGAKEGHKLDAINRCARACYTVLEKGTRPDGEWAYHVKSVVVFGTVSLVTNEEKAKEICLAIGAKFTDDKAYWEREWESAKTRVQCLELTPQHMTGKLVKES
ncbi:MAG: pyridoxamine 5'-phosphate oxidase family protein [Clostridia bacterium]|nr:pyridoxamine 5'-phosphate oxidase family protein [Clostridia bacterium]